MVTGTYSNLGKKTMSDHSIKGALVKMSEIFRRLISQKLPQGDTWTTTEPAATTTQLLISGSKRVHRPSENLLPL